MNLFEITVLVLLLAILLLMLVMILRNKKSTSHDHPEKSKIGLPAQTGEEIVAKLQVTDATATFRFELPGGVSKTGKTYRNSIIPVGVMDMGNKPSSKFRFISLHFSEVDMQETDKALKLFANYKHEEPVDFRIFAESNEITFGEIAKGFEEGSFGIESPVPIQMKVSMRFRNNTESVISNPFKGTVVPMATRGPGGYEGETEGHHLFDCHGHWYSTFGFARHTLCHGPCTTGSCLTWWNRKKWEDGWQTCSC